MTEAKRQEAGRTRFLLLPPLSAAEREAERESERKLSVVLAEMFGPKGTTAIRRSRRHTRWTPARNPMTDAGLMGKASIDWDHLDTTDSTGELGSLINLARPRGFHVSAAADEIFEVEEKLTGRCVCHGTAAQVHRWLREKPIGEQTR
jgi:hypothetical protein